MVFFRYQFCYSFLPSKLFSYYIKCYPNGCRGFVECFCSTCFWRRCPSPCSWSCSAATITNFIVISGCNRAFVFCAFAFHSIFIWQLAYLQSCCKVFPVCVDWHPRLHLLLFHRLRPPKGSVERDQISGLTPCFELLMILLSFVRSKLCRHVGFLLLRNLAKTSVSGFFFPIA